MAPTYLTIGYLLNLLTEEKQFPLVRAALIICKILDAPVTLQGVSVLQKSLKMGIMLNDEVYDMVLPIDSREKLQFLC